MMKLSDRLQIIANYIGQGESVADIGTDHGFLPIVLSESGKCPHVVLSDINEGPLEKAKINIQKHCPGQEFDLRIGSGIRTIQAGEVDTIVIAGMGGLLIAEILGDDLDKAKSFKKLILQPRNAQDKLRRWLFENGFMIEDETLVRERKYLCEILFVTPGRQEKSLQLPENAIDYEISPILFRKKDPLLVEFIENKIRIENKVREAIQAKAVKKKEEMLRESEERVKLLCALRERSDRK